jgi:hypothetical protein
VPGDPRQRPVLTPSRHASVNEPWIDLPAVIWAEPETLSRARTHAFDQDVRRGNKLENDLYASRLLEIEGDARPTSVHEVVRAARERLTARAVNPDDVCAQVGQDHAGMWARANPGKLHNPKAGERTVLSALRRHRSLSGWRFEVVRWAHLVNPGG